MKAPIMAISAQDLQKLEAQITVMNFQLMNWIGFFENDFEHDESQNYARMQTYIETVEWMEKQGLLFATPSREEIKMQVKERMSERRI